MKIFKNIIFLTAFIICGIICLPCQLKAFAAAAENENFARLNTDLQLLTITKTAYPVLVRR